MANNTAKKETGSNLTPVIIIGGILLATVFGIYMISSSSGDGNANDTKPTNTSTNGNKAPTNGGKATNYDTAPAGATPAHFKGSNSATVVLEEFADYQCPTCAVVHPKMQEVTSKYGERIKVIFRNYPLTQMHPKAYDAAVAAEAAGLQDKFWQMQDMIFRNQTSWVGSQNHKQDFAKYAKTLGLDADKFSSDMLGLPAKSRVDADMKRGRTLNITSTPSVLLNGKLIPFSQMNVEGISALVDAELKKTNPTKDDSPTKPEEEPSDMKEKEKSEDKPNK